MPVMPYRDRATTALMQAVIERLNREIVDGVIGAGFTDIRPAHGSVMSQLVHQDGLRTSELASFASMTAQSMGELVDDLERLGYVERRPDPADRRAKLVYLTTRGHEAVAASGDAVRAQEADLTRRLGVKGRERLRGQLLSLLEESPGRPRGAV